MSKLQKWLIKYDWVPMLITFASIFVVIALVFVLILIQASEAMEMKRAIEELKLLTDSLVNSF